MAEKAKNTTYAELEKQVKAGKIAPVYLLMGDEDYYIDKAEHLITQSLLTPEESAFNLDVLYGASAKAGAVANVARQYPVMANKRVVVVREFQSLRDKDELTAYVSAPTPTTVLILCHKHEPMKTARGLLTAVKKEGIVMDSPRLYQEKVGHFVFAMLKEQGVHIDYDAAELLAQHVGTDITRQRSETDKLRLMLGNGGGSVTAKHVEELTGESREYSNYELQNALAERDAQRAMRICNYFATQPKGFSLQMTLANIYGLFTDVVQTYWAPDKTPQGISAWLSKPEWQVKKAILPAHRNYTVRKVMDIISELRRTDGRSKGIDNCRLPEGELLRELIVFILAA